MKCHHRSRLLILVIITFAERLPDLATAQATRPARPTTQEVELVRHAQDAQVQRILDDPDRPRWAALPTFIRNVWFDSSGKAWFGADAPDGDTDDASLKASVEDAHAGRTRVLREASPLLIDRHHRFWVEYLQTLQCYDGNQWTKFTLTPPPSPPQPQFPPGVARRFVRPPVWSFFRPGFEDNEGNCWFLAGAARSGWTIIRVGPDAQVHQYPIETETRDPATGLFNDPEFSQTADGSVMLVADLVQGADPPFPGGPRIPTMLILRWKGEKWERIDPGFCKHVIQFVLPHADGSIQYICSGGRIWTYWLPESSETGVKKAQAELADLASPSAERRDQATRALLTIGPQIVARLPVAEDASRPPDARLRMEMIRKNYEDLPAVDGDDLHSEPAAYDSDVNLGRVSPIAHSYDGGVVVYAKDVQERKLGKVHDQALVWIAPDGALTINPASEDAEQDPRGRSSLGTGFLDRNSQLWRWGWTVVGHAGVRTTVVTDRAGARKYGAPPGLVLDWIAGQDSDGQIFAATLPLAPDRRSIVIFDERKPADTLWNPQTAPGYGPFSAEPVGSGWIRQTHDDLPLRLSRLDATPVDIPTDGLIVTMYDLLPLTNRGVIIRPTAREAGTKYYLYTGREWIASEPSLATMARENLETLRGLAANTFDAFDNARIAADQKGGLWVGEIRYNSRVEGIRTTIQVQRTLIYHDGKEWHDVMKDLRDQKISNPRIIRCADHGNALVIDGGSQSLWVTYERGQIQILRGRWRSVPNIEKAQFADDPGGGLWIGQADSDRPPSLLDHERVEVAPFRGVPLLGDSKGRVWFYDRQADALVAKVGSRWLKKPIEGLTLNTRMLESPDGRVWVIHRMALSRVDVEGDGDAMRVVESRRWAWDAPKSSIGAVVLDPNAGLWFDGGAGRAVRYSLPAE